MADPILYDHTGTLIPMPGTVPPPSDFSIYPSGVEDSIYDRSRGYFSRDLSPMRLASIMEEADYGNPRDWFALCEEILEKDPKIQSVFQTRMLAVKGLNREVLPAELDDDATQADRDLAEEIADHCGKALFASNFGDLIEDIMDAVGKPFSVDWIYWGLDRQGKLAPQKFCKIPGTHLIWGVKENVLRVIDPAKPQVYDGEWGEILPPFTTVRALSNIRRELSIRSGLMRTLAWYYLFKITALKLYMVYMERYGMPLRIAKINAQQFSTKSFYDAIRAGLKTLGSDGSGVFSSDTEIQILAAAAKGGADVYDKIIDIVNREIAQLVLGHELSSQSSKGSGQLGITAALEVRQDYLEGDCQWLTAIVRQDIFRPMTEWNYGADAVLNGMVPVLWIDYEPPKDLIAEADIRAVVAQTFPKMAHSEAQVREQFGINPPIGQESSPDDVLMPASGGGGLGGVNLPPSPREGTPSPLINAAPSYRPRKSRKPKRYSQGNVDRYAARNAATLKTAEDIVRREVVAVLKQTLADGGSYSDARAAVIKSYSGLSVGTIEQLLREGMELTRLAGRNGG